MRRNSTVGGGSSEWRVGRNASARHSFMVGVAQCVLVLIDVNICEWDRTYINTHGVVIYIFASPLRSLDPLHLAYALMFK